MIMVDMAMGYFYKTVKVKVFTYIALFRSLPTRILIKGALQ